MSTPSGYAICGHCNQLLSAKTVKQHRRLFFHDGKWIIKAHEDGSILSDTHGSSASSPISLSPCASDCGSDFGSESALNQCMDVEQDDSAPEQHVPPEDLSGVDHTQSGR